MNYKADPSVVGPSVADTRRGRKDNVQLQLFILKQTSEKLLAENRAIVLILCISAGVLE